MQRVGEPACVVSREERGTWTSAAINTIRYTVCLMPQKFEIHTTHTAYAPVILAISNASLRQAGSDACTLLMISACTSIEKNKLNDGNISDLQKKAKLGTLMFESPEPLLALTG
jgi:hypothetical protein